MESMSSDEKHYAWHTSTNIPTEQVGNQLMPVMDAQIDEIQDKGPNGKRDVKHALHTPIQDLLADDVRDSTRISVVKKGGAQQCEPIEDVSSKYGPGDIRHYGVVSEETHHANQESVPRHMEQH